MGYRGHVVNTLAKGNSFRHKVAEVFRFRGFDVSVRGIGYAGDDLVVRGRTVELSVEAKNQKRMALSVFLDQAVANAGADQTPVVVMHRVGRAAAGEAYAVLRLDDLVDMVSELDGGARLYVTAGHDVEVSHAVRA